MKTVFSTILFALILNFSFAQNVEVKWAKPFSGGGLELFDNESYSVAVDNNGNVYTTGYFKGTIDFDPGPGVFNLTSNDVSNIFIAKLDANGNFVWAKQMTGDQDGASLAITSDPLNNIYVIGSFSGTVDFDPGPGVTNLSNPSLFVCKLNTDGNLIWVKQLGEGGGNMFGYGITVDKNGNVYTTGRQAGGDFDPGPAEYILNSPGMFISKLDANGDFVWAKEISTIPEDGFYGIVDGLSIATDASGYIYTTGAYTYNSVDFDPGPGVYLLPSSNLFSQNYSDIFVLKLDVNGNFVWARQMGGSSAVGQGYSLSLDPEGNVVVTGDFIGAVDFDPGVGVFTFADSNNVADIFITKFDNDGNFIWAKQLAAGQGNDHGNSVATDNTGNIYSTGYFTGTADFDPGVSQYILTSYCDADVYISKIDTEGNFVWAKKMGGYGSDAGNGIALDGLGNVYTTGKFQVEAYFDTITINASGFYYNMFVEKISPCTNCPATLCLGNRVWNDLNNNGIDDNEPGLADVTLNLYKDNNNDNLRDGCPVMTTKSNSDGTYSFCDLFPGNYIVGAVVPDGYTSSIKNGGEPDNNIDRDDNGQIMEDNEIRGLSITLTAGSEPDGNTNNTYDFGFIKGPLCVGNRVWNDLDNNGKDNNEPGLEGITLNLYKVIHNNDNPLVGTAIAVTTTNANGNYSFCGLQPGKYIIGIVTPAGYKSSTVNGGDPNNDKDGDDNGIFTYDIETRGLAMTLAEGTEPGSSNINNTYDFGFRLSGNNNKNKADTEKSVLSNSKINNMYPNPFSETITVGIDSKEAAKASIRVIDIHGKVLVNIKQSLQPGINQFTIKDLEKLSKGLYLVEIKTEKETLIKRVIKK